LGKSLPSSTFPRRPRWQLGRRELLGPSGEDHRGVEIDVLVLFGEVQEGHVVGCAHMGRDHRQVRVPVQQLADRAGPGVLGRYRHVPRMDHDRRAGLADQRPHRIKQRVDGGEAPYLQVELEDPRPVAEGIGHVPGRARFRVERGRRQAPLCAPGELHRPRVQVGGHVRPVRIGERTEQLHVHGAQVL
jgi:hypothetical protein